MSYYDKVYLVTGSSSGIGEELVKQLISSGAKVAGFARRRDRLDALSQSLGEKSSSFLITLGDVTKPEDLKNAAEQMIQKWGRIDGVIANAGFGVSGDFSDLTVDDYRRQFETNIFGVLNTLYATFEELKKSKGSAAIIASVSGYLPTPGISAYNVSKAAVRMLADTLYLEWKKHGIHMMSVCPGFVASEIRQVDNQGLHHAEAKDPVPQNLVVPTDVAVREILDSLDNQKAEVVVTGHGKVMVFLQRHFPCLVRWAMMTWKITGRPQPSAGSVKE